MRVAAPQRAVAATPSRAVLPGKAIRLPSAPPSRQAAHARASRAPRCLSASDAPPPVSAARGWNVYVLKTPLIGLEGVGALLGGAYPAALEHAVALLVAPDGTVVAHDFVPERPTSPLTALALLSGVGAPGVLRARQMRFAGGLPQRRCWRVGGVSFTRLLALQPASEAAVSSEAEAVAAAVARFDAAWPRTLRLRSADCCAHVDAFVFALTGLQRAMSYDPRRKTRR